MAITKVKIKLRNKTQRYSAPGSGYRGGSVVSAVSDNAAYADRAGFAERAGEARHAAEATRADYAAMSGKASSATEADVARDLREDSPVWDKVIRKDRSDRTPFDLAVGGRLTPENGISSKNFAEGMTGTGYFIDAEGNVWIKSLHCREFIEVPELRYNRVDIQTGTSWSAPGGGLVESTESSYTDADGNTHGALLLESGLHLATEDGGLFISETAQPSGNTGWVNLKLEEGEFGAVEVGDICMGLWHFLDTSLNATADLDSNGNMAVKGFGTVYFEILEVSADNTRFRYKLRDGYPLHPQPGMNFVCYGNKAKKADGTWAHLDRQKSRYSTRTYERFLANVTDYTYGISNIMMQFGDLSNLTVNGKNLSGYSAYLKNVYFTGILEQIREESPLVLTLETIGSPYVTETETCKVIAHVTQGFSEVPLSRLTFVTADDVGDEASYEAQTEQLNELGYFIVGRGDLTYPTSLMQIQVTTDDGKQARAEFVFYDRDLLKGQDGKDGKDGNDGDKGDKGDKGDTGDKGDKGDKGDTGIAGAIKRGVDPWTKGTRYYDGKTGENGNRFLDWVYTEDAYHNVSIYMCIKPHLASDGTVKDTDGNTIAANIPGTEGGKAYWAQVSNVGNLYASTLFAPNASISFMTGQEIVLVEKLEDGTTRVYARLGTGRHPFWVGGETAETATYAMDNTGRTRYGKKDERHITIDPNEKKILVYDDDTNLALEVSGERRTPTELMGGNGASSGTLICNLKEPTSGSTTEPITEAIITEFPAIGNGAVISISIELKATANQTVWTPGIAFSPTDPSTPDIPSTGTGDINNPITGLNPIGPAMPVTARASVTAYLERQVDATTWEVVSSQGIVAMSVATGSPTKTATVVLGSGRLMAGNYRLRVAHVLTPGKRVVNGSTYTCGCSTENGDALYTINYNAQMASLLANGYFIGTGTANMAAMWLDDSVINAIFRNSQAGFRLNGNGLYASLKGGQWNRVPLPLFRGCSWTDSDGKWQLSHVQSIDGQWPTLSVNNGVYQIKFPTSWKSLFATDEWKFSDYWRINARINGTQQAFWSVNNFSASGVDIHVMNNQGTGFFGAVWFEIEFLGIPEY